MIDGVRTSEFTEFLIGPFDQGRGFFDRTIPAKESLALGPCCLPSS